MKQFYRFSVVCVVIGRAQKLERWNKESFCRWQRKHHCKTVPNLALQQHTIKYIIHTGVRFVHFATFLWGIHGTLQSKSGLKGDIAPYRLFNIWSKQNLMGPIFHLPWFIGTILRKNDLYMVK